MSNPKIKNLKKELEEILRINNGFLTPEKVVEYAKNKKTALHEKFCWDDTEAAKKYRLMQASQIIRNVKVEIVHKDNPDYSVKIREYVSLPADRGLNGYREINQVLTEDDLRLQFIESVQAEFEAIKNKLRKVSEVAFQKAEAVSKAIEKERQIAAGKIKPRPRA